MKTLVVLDDEAGVRRAIAREARRARSGYRCELLASHTQAVAFVDRLATGDASADGFIVDVRLRDGSGLDILARVRAMLPDVPAVVITGDPSTRDAAAALAAGWLQKPIAPISEIFVELEGERAHAVMLTHDAVKLLAHVAELRVWEERMVAAIGAGAEASDLHERMGLDESACKTRLYRAGVRTGLGSVDIITRVLRILCRRGETGLDEVERLGVRVRSRPTSQVKP